MHGFCLNKNQLSFNRAVFVATRDRKPPVIGRERLKLFDKFACLVISREILIGSREAIYSRTESIYRLHSLLRQVAPWKNIR
jgi:hypothetical protein